MSNGSTTSLLNFQLEDESNGFDLHATLLNIATNVHQITLTDAESILINALVIDQESSVYWKEIKFNPQPVSVEHDPEAMQALIELSLKELEKSEASLQSLERKEEVAIHHKFVLLCP